MPSFEAPQSLKTAFSLPPSQTRFLLVRAGAPIRDPGPAPRVSLCGSERGGGLPEKKFQDLLRTILRDDLEVEPQYYITGIRTFEEAGVPSEDRGLVVTMSDGSEYHITIRASESSEGL